VVTILVVSVLSYPAGAVLHGDLEDFGGVGGGGAVVVGLEHGQHVEVLVRAEEEALVGALVRLLTQELCCELWGGRVL
jgi:hypothetical protein